MKTIKRILRYVGRALGLRQWLIEMKQPKMIWGYHTLSGNLLHLTRISNTVLTYHNDKIKINNNVFIGHYCILDGIGGLEIGEGTQIAAGVYIFTHSSHIAIRIYGMSYTKVPELEKKASFIKPVKIGRYVFIGAGAKILPGVEIGDFALIGAGALINSNIPKYSIVKGNPAKIVGDVRHLDEKYLTQYPELKDTYVIPSSAKSPFP